jgi:hypothetical protein
MSDGMSLEQLKQQNADEEAVLQNQALDQELEVEDSDLDDTELDLEEGGAEEPDGESSEPVVESWAQADEVQEQPQKTIPLHEHIDIRTKLKGERNEYKDKFEKLQQEFNQFKQTQQTPVSNQQTGVVVPDIKQFTNEYDEVDHTAYHQAMTKYQQDLVSEQFKTQSETLEQQRQREQQEAQLQQVIDNISTQANKLVEKKLVDAGKFNESYNNLSAHVMQLVPDNHEAVMGGILAEINTVTRGSEDAAKLVYKLGVDPIARQKVFDAYMQDPSGKQGLLELVDIRDKFKKPVTKRSQAPKPPKQVQGESLSGTSAQASKMQKRYNDLHKKGQSGKAFKVKREAKAQGIDTKSW